MIYGPGSNPNGPNSGGGGRQVGSCCDDIKTWWSGVPFFCKFLISVNVTLWIADLFLGGLLSIMTMNVPLFTIYNLNLWRIFTSCYSNKDIFMLLFGLLSIYYDAKTLEQSLGTAYYFLDFTFKNVTVQIVYTIVCFVISLFWPPVLMLPSYGLWNTVMVYITLRASMQPENQTNFLCCPFTVKQKFYPWLIFLLMNIFAFPRLDFLCAILLGYYEAWFRNGMCLRLSKEYLRRFQTGLCCKCFSDRPDFITVDGCDGRLFQQQGQGGNMQGSQSSGGGSSILSRPSRPASQPFSGQGQTLSSATSQPQQYQQVNQGTQQQQQSQPKQNIPPPPVQGNQQQAGKFYPPPKEEKEKQSADFKGQGVTLGGSDPTDLIPNYEEGKDGENQNQKSDDNTLI